MVVNLLLGPAGGPDKELDQREDRVTGRYLVGMLAPKSTPVEAEQQDSLASPQRPIDLPSTKVPQSFVRCHLAPIPPGGIFTP